MTVELILSRLEKVKKAGNQYKALCPAHQDKSPSLYIKDAGDKVLLKCFSGCEAADILAAIGLELSDLYPESNFTSIERKRFAQEKRRERLQAEVGQERHILLIAQAEIKRGIEHTEADKQRVQQACNRLDALLRELGQ